MSTRPKERKHERTSVIQSSTSSKNNDERPVIEVTTPVNETPVYHRQQDWRWYAARVLGRRHPYERLPPPPPASPTSAGASSTSSSPSPPSLRSTLTSSTSCPSIPEAVLSPGHVSLAGPVVAKPVPIRPRTSCRCCQQVGADVEQKQTSTDLRNQVVSGSMPPLGMAAVGVTVLPTAVKYADPATPLPGTTSATPNTAPHTTSTHIPRSSPTLTPVSHTGNNKPKMTFSKDGQDSEEVTHKSDREDMFCSTPCQKRYEELSLQLVDAKEMIYTMAVQIEEQASQLQALMDENRLYGRGETHLGGMRDYPRFGRNGCGTHNDDGRDSTGSLEEKMMALELQNTELRLCFERERRKREEAEAKLTQEQGYIRRLEDNVKSLRGTRVVMDPGTYREVAEAYIAARRTPTRTHHHGRHYQNSDLVCDHAPRKTVVTSSISCPTSPSRSPVNHNVRSPPAYSLAGSITREETPERRRGSPPTHTMDPWDYKQLLDSLEDIS